MLKMDLIQIEQLAYSKMKDRKTLGREKGFIYYHGRRVAKIAVNIYENVADNKTSEEKNLLYCGCLFHDIGKGIEPHNETGALITREYLKEFLTPNQLDTVSEVVYQHNRRGHEYINGILGKIAQDADILDHMGSMDIWIAFMYHANFEESVDESLKFFDGGKWEEITKMLRALINYPISLDAFDRRKDFTQKFIETFKREADGSLF